VVLDTADNVTYARDATVPILINNSAYNPTTDTLTLSSSTARFMIFQWANFCVRLKL
jgi:hypothetical protein